MGLSLEGRGIVAADFEAELYFSICFSDSLVSCTWNGIKRTLDCLVIAVVVASSFEPCGVVPISSVFNGGNCCSPLVTALTVG